MNYNCWGLDVKNVEEVIRKGRDWKMQCDIDENS